MKLKLNNNILKKILILLLVILVIKLIYDEYTYIVFIFQYLFKGRPWAAIPLPRNVQNTIVKIINNLPPNKYRFIDFGCGDGEVINLIYNNQKTEKADCVEIEPRIANIAKNRFKGIDKIEVMAQDMNDYNYVDTPTILFMYEPLWSFKKEEALKIYTTILSKIPQNIKPFYIIYVSGVKHYLDQSFFDSLGFKFKEYYKLNRFLGLKSNYVYVFERK